MGAAGGCHGRGRGSFLVMAKRSRVHFELVSVWFMGRREKSERIRKRSAASEVNVLRFIRLC